MKKDFIKYLKEYSINALFIISISFVVLSIGFLIFTFLMVITHIEFIRAIIGFFISIIVLIISYSLFKTTDNYLNRRK